MTSFFTCRPKPSSFIRENDMISRYENRLRYGLLLLPVVLYFLLFIILPYIKVLQFSFWKVENYRAVSDFSLANFAHLFGNPMYLQVIWNSLVIAFWVTISANIIGYPLAYFLAFVAKRKNLFYFMIILPLWTSFLLRAYIWKLILGRNGLLNGLLIYFGLIDEPVSLFLYNRFSICLTLTYIFVPFVALPIYTSLEKINPRYLEASMDLGASSWLTFRKIVLPLSLPGVITGSTFAFCLSFGDFVTPALLGGPSNLMISNVIIGQFGGAFNWPFGSALALVVLLLIMTVISLLSILEKRQRISAD
jgi:spermidine/putrescine transport system permease protein